MTEASSKVIFVPFIDAFGGVERLLLQLSKHLNAHGIGHVIGCFRESIGLQNYADWPLQICQLKPSRQPLVEARALKAFLQDSRRNGGDAPLLFDLKSAFYSGLMSAGPFFLHLTDPPSLLPADVSKHAITLRHSAKPVESRETVKSIRAEAVHRLNRRGVRRALKVIAMTEKIKWELKQLYDIDAVVVRPGVEEITYERLQDRNRLVRILSVSRLEQNKRIDWVLKALAALQAIGKLPDDWFFEVVGDGSERNSLARLVEDLGIGRHTHFRGHLDAEELNRAYAKASLFLMPAVQGYGLPALEALRRHIPSIVHKESGVSELLGGSKWVELIDGDNGQLQSAIGKMIDRLRTTDFEFGELPDLPTSTSWAEQICHVCGWISDRAA